MMLFRLFIFRFCLSVIFIFILCCFSFVFLVHFSFFSFHFPVDNVDGDDSLDHGHGLKHMYKRW